jgi:hypothetical protein
VRSIWRRSSSWRSSASNCRIAVARQAAGARVVGRPGRAGLGAQAERAADALDVDADHARALALAAERGDGQAREVAHQRLLPVAQRLRDLLAQRLEVQLGAAASIPPPSVTPSRTAAISAARKKKRSKTRSKTRRSSCDLASVAASASLKSAGSLHGTSRRTANASSSSLVPSATPSPRSSSPSSRMRALSPAAPRSGSPPP